MYGGQSQAHRRLWGKVCHDHAPDLGGGQALPQDSPGGEDSLEADPAHPQPEAAGRPAEPFLKLRGVGRDPERLPPDLDPKFPEGFQPYLEKRFSGLKTDLEIAPVYLKKPHRVAALVHAYFIALVVGSLIEREVRRAMTRAGIEALPLLPEGRMTKTPTCPRILETFNGVAWQEFTRGDEVIAFPIELTTIQKEMIRLLGLSPQAYKQSRREAAKFTLPRIAKCGMWVEKANLPTALPPPFFHFRK